MAALGPWPGTRRIAVAVSGGADSLCLAMLSARWAASRGIEPVCLIVDHRLRAGSGQEAASAASQLSGWGLRARILVAEGIEPGPALAERARVARYAALTRACREEGVIDLLVGHHAGDQAETVLMRSRAGSGPDGVAGMASLSESADLRLLRPLLSVLPKRLRSTLEQLGVGWMEDPSNRDARMLRTRLRHELAQPGGPELARALAEEAARQGQARMRRDREQADQLAGGAVLRPQGFALLPPGLLPARALASLIRAVTGAPYPPPPESVAALVRQPRPATLAGARLLPAGRLGSGWLLVREAARMQGPVPAVPGVLWDRRFRLHAAHGLPAGLRVEAASAGAAPRAGRGLPAAVRAAMPALRDGSGGTLDAGRFEFEPAAPATGRPLFAGSVAGW